MYVKVDLMNKFRKLWEQHVMWTRSFIISTIDELDDLVFVTKRLLRNPPDFAEVFRMYYGDDIANEFGKLFTEHLMIAADLVNAGKEGNTENVAIFEAKWYDNADQLASFLAEINPYWNEDEWKQMLYSHLRMTAQEAANRFVKNYEKDIEDYDMIEDEALKMADYMTLGIIQQFQL